MNSASRVERIRTLLIEMFSPSELIIIDDSEKHRGHLGAQSGAGHFQISITSQAFIGKTTIESHRLVYFALQSMLPHEIHALNIQTKAPNL